MQLSSHLRRLLTRRALPLAIGVLALTGCNPGAYPFDYFREMHYQQSQHLLEPQRLSPPDGSVPRTGGRPQISFAGARDLQNPVRSTPDTQKAGVALFKVNCAVCHGAAGNGESFVAQRFTANHFVPPADLASSRVRNRTDGELDWIIDNGIGGMPPFRDLLTEDQVWALVNQVRAVQGQQR
ncbi:MAG: cytochrome c [Chloroflexi bacterium]|nr:cytochrome c [Chloroflexota bacterium]